MKKTKLSKKITNNIQKRLISNHQLPIFKIIARKLEKPILILSFFWLIIIIFELVYGMSPLLLWIGTSIWIVFLLYILLKLLTVPNRVLYLKKNWLLILSILVPVLRLFPYLQKFTIARALTASFGMQLIRIFASADIGMRSLRMTLGKRDVGYAFTLTSVVILAGAAGMFSFEKESIDPNGIHSYSKAIWWTSMQMTNIGSGYRPTTIGGQAVCLGISIYAAAMFGYLTAVLATFIIDRESNSTSSDIESQKSIQKLQDEVVLLRKSIEDLLAKDARIIK